jgi:hypothetical protein
MAKNYYQWQRYWRPRGSALLFFENGFLFSPGKLNSHVLPFEKIADVPCLVLLGEPGMGKSYAMEAELDLVSAKASEQGQAVLFRDLRSYRKKELRAKVFENPVFQTWIKGDHMLHLFLDSFDECRISIKRLASLLADELQEYQAHSQRLKLRIACRTAEWPGLLENGLKKIWGAESVQAYELAPLTSGDVRVAAVAEGFDPDHFLAEVERCEAGPLAAKPVTLRLLLNLYGSGRALPASQLELYARGCAKLAEEPNDSYIEAGITGKLKPPQRMAVAARIAAVTIFCQKSSIWTSPDCGEPADGDVKVAELCGGVEYADGMPFEVDEAAIKETINTGLFDSRDEDRMGWWHQTYAEFLAAWYLVRLQTPTDQILKLLVHSGDPDGRLVPQLHETAAWLAGMAPDLFEEIMRRDPKVLLQSDVASADPASRASLVEEVLKLYNEERDFDNDWSRPAPYHKLDHPAIADQLRPFIVNRENGYLARRAAIEMAEDCKTTSLQDDLAQVALDTSETFDLRVLAARAVSEIGDVATKLKLKPLVTIEAGDDPDRDLQRMGLRALWPDNLLAHDVFSLLSSPGLNKHFISQDLIDGLKPSDLPVALGWVEQQPTSEYMDYYERKLMNGIMSLAWDRLDAPSVLKAFAPVALSRIRKGDRIVEDRGDGFGSLFPDDANPRLKFAAQWDQDERKRHLMLETIASLSSEDNLTGNYFFPSQMRKSFGGDMLWMLGRLSSEASEERRRMWARLIRLASNWGDLEQRIAILTACQNSQDLIQAFSSEIIALHHHLMEASQKTEEQAPEPDPEEATPANPPPDPPVDERVTILLDESEAGESEAWWKLNWMMRFKEDRYPVVSEFAPNVKLYPGWRRADSSTRMRILAAARRYLVECDARTNEWLGTNNLCYEAYSGYQALRLLYEEDQAFFLTLDGVVWKKWAPIIATYEIFDDVGDEERAIRKRLVEAAYFHAPDEVIETVLVGMDRDYAHLPNVIKGCWDERLGRALLDKAKELRAKRRNITNLLDDLLAHGDQEARNFVESLLKSPLPSDPLEKQQLVDAADLLMKHSRDAAWSVIWPLIQDDVEFGRWLMGKQADLLRRSKDKNPPIPRRLTEEQLADLYMWMLRQYPPAEDIRIKGCHTLSAREVVEQWRDSILNYLRGLGTAPACSAIERVCTAFPELTWVKAQLLAAQTVHRQRSWHPSSPAAILKIAEERQQQMSRGDNRISANRGGVFFGDNAQGNIVITGEISGDFIKGDKRGS